MKYVVRHYTKIADFEADANKHDGYVIHSFQPLLEKREVGGYSSVEVGYHVVYAELNPAPVAQERKPIGCR